MSLRAGLAACVLSVRPAPGGHVHPRRGEGPWERGLLPDGDCASTLAPDGLYGTLGHLWELSVCVFGAAHAQRPSSHVPTGHPPQRPEGPSRNPALSVHGSPFGACG
ncbi:DUF2716 domain-containing protein [Deinococcus maricopensis]|uniref:DUF2716 domain-containing protein n=1 Tax=Deinococcus maricopensis TaxID=309887 RepID=UPI000A04C6FD